MFRVGQKLGEYQIVAQLRTGGMATLWLGERVGAAGFARRVAIKVVHPHLAADARFVQMLIDEALLAARIQHANVIHIEQLGEVDGTHFLAMEYVHGGSLAELLRALATRGFRLSPQLAVWIALQIADGLNAAHETRDDAGALLGVVHRDVSPQNVLLSFTGQVKVIDFGIAKAVGRGLQTDVGALKGKLPYMAPEQAYGRAIDRRTDVYALGIVLWELLTMQRLFHAEDHFELLETVRHPRIEPPSTYAPDLAPALDAAVMAALAPVPDTRPQTALEFRQRLAEALPGALTLESSHLAALMVSALEYADAEQAPVPLASMVGSAVETLDGLATPASSGGFAALLMSPREGAATAAGVSPASAAVGALAPSGAPALAPTPQGRPPTIESSRPTPTPTPATVAPRSTRQTPRWMQLGALLVAAVVGAAGARAVARREASHADTNAPPPPVTAPVPARTQPPARNPAATRAAIESHSASPSATAAEAPRTEPPGAISIGDPSRASHAASDAVTAGVAPSRPPRTRPPRSRRARRRARGPQYVDGLPLVGEP